MKKTIAALLSAAMLALILTACGSSPVILPEDGVAEGKQGDTMRTYFFDYTVNSAYTCSKYEGYIPSPGYDLLVAEVTVKNTFGESITMFDWDFLVLFDDDTQEEDVYDYPIELDPTRMWKSPQTLWLPCSPPNTTWQTMRAAAGSFCSRCLPARPISPSLI